MHRYHWLWMSLYDLMPACVLGLLLLPLLPEIAQAFDHSLSQHASKSAWQQLSSNLPLAFIPNHGQEPASVAYYADTVFGRVAFTPQGLRLQVQQGTATVAIQLTFAGANVSAYPTAEWPLPGKTHLYVGNDPTRWHTNLPMYRALTYHDLYPGIDATFTGVNGRLIYTFVVRPGADPRQIQLMYQSVDGLSLGTHGDLRIHTRHGTLHDQAPLTYQTIAGRRTEIPTTFHVFPSSSSQPATYGFQVAAYDTRYPLYIDPLLFAAYIGGSGWDAGIGVAVTADGSDVYITGRQSLTNQRDATSNAFVVRMNLAAANGPEVVYFTTLGGNNFDEGYDIAVDSEGNAYVGGLTISPDLATTPGAFQPAPPGCPSAPFPPLRTCDAFVARLSPEGELTYLSYVGGGGYEPSNVVDGGMSLALDTARNVYLGGKTMSSDFPVTARAYKTQLSGSADVFIVKMHFSGMGQNDLLYATYLGGTTGVSESLCAITVDRQGRAIYASGFTDATDFVTTPGAFQRHNGGRLDAWVTVLHPLGNGDDDLVYSTLLGGAGSEEAPGLAVDESGAIYFAGPIGSPGFATPGAFQEQLQGSASSNIGDGYLAVLRPNATGTADLQYLTYLGGATDTSAREEQAWDLALGSHNTVYLTGWTNAADFPTTAEGFDRDLNNGEDGDCNDFLTADDAWVAVLQPRGLGARDLLFATYIGGCDREQGLRIVADRLGNAYVTGFTASPDFPHPVADGVTAQGFAGGVADAFVAVVSSLCIHAGDANLDGHVTPADAVLVWQHYLDGVMAPLSACRQVQANVHQPESPVITPADARCILRRFLGHTSC